MFKINFLLSENKLPLSKSKSEENLSNYKILVVEDNKINQIITKKILEKFNYDCFISDNGYIAIVDEKKLQSLQESDAIRTIVQQENNARSIIFVKSSGATKSNEAKAMQFAVEFAKEQQAKAKKGDWIQNNDGRWVKK